MYKNAEPLKELLAECVDGEALAEAMGLCSETIRRQADQGKLPFLKVGSKRLFHIPTVMKAMMSKGEAA